MRKIISLLLILTISVAGTNAITPATRVISRDSMRTKWANGKKFLMHKVAKGETFYSISRDYKVEVKELMNANKGITQLKTGQIIHVPVAENYDAAVKQQDENEKQTDVVSEESEQQTLVPVAQKTTTLETVDKNIYHTVRKGETLSAISKKYSVPVNEIAALNSLKKNQIKAGQKLVIKKTGKTEVKSPPVENTAQTGNSKTTPANESEHRNIVVTKYHIVKKGETLYGISKQYSTSAKNITDWNNLKSTSVKIGQQLIVKNGETLTMPDQETVRTKVADENTMDTPKTAAVETKVNEIKEASATESPVESSVNIEVIDKTPSGKNIKQSIESGEAAWVNDGDLNPNKYFGLHRTAPIGTIVKVTNRMNGKYVFVKVIGKLPGTGDNEKLIIKISKAASDRLGVIDPTFQCELNYAFASEN